MKLVAFLASFGGKGSESSCYTPVSTTPFLQSAMLLFTSIGSSLPTPAPYSDVLRNSPFLYFILLISTQVSREVVYFSSHFHALTFHWPKNIVLLREPLRPKALLGPDYMIRDLIGSFSLRLPIVIGRLK